MRNILFYGAGAVNLSLLAWVARERLNITVLARPSSADALRGRGVRVECGGTVSEAHPEVVTSLAGMERPDVIFIGVKTYALAEAVEDIREAFGKEVPVLSVLNGIRHVDMLRSKFTHAMFATICFNAYREGPGRAVAMSRGPLVFTSGSSTSHHVRRDVFGLFKGRVEAMEKKDPMDVACNKLIINLTNALMTMVAFHDNRDRELSDLQYVTSRVLWEGVLVMRANGVRETRIPGVPSWGLFRLSRFLPQFITLPIFRKKMKVSAINSMAQDIASGSADTEIEEINGQLLRMAEHVDIKTPFNKGLYNMFNEWAEDPSVPLTPSQVRSKIRAYARK